VTLLNDMGISQALGNHIMKLPDGHTIVEYLVGNRAAFDSVNTADGYTAGGILKQIAAEASKLKPTQSSAPKPADTLDGSGVGEKIHPLLDGVTFE
jgi:hypothetical protein